jgi:hypothetical protein
MPAPALNVNAVLMCPHGGKVTIVPTSSVLFDGAPVALGTDAFSVAGCAFTLPGPKPSPCVTVRWESTDKKVTVGGVATLSQTSSGICYSAEQAAQGPVIITSTQAKVKTT